MYLDSSTTNTETINAWYRHDSDGRVVIDNGDLLDGEIKLTPDQGRQFTYQQSQRVREESTNYSQDLRYDDDGRLTTVSGPGFSSSRQYRDDGPVIRYEENSHGSNKTESLIIDPAGRMLDAIQDSGGNSAHSHFLDYTPTGLCLHQHTDYSGEGHNRDDIYNTYRPYGEKKNA